MPDTPIERLIRNALGVVPSSVPCEHTDVEAHQLEYLPAWMVEAAGPYAIFKDADGEAVFCRTCRKRLGPWQRIGMDRG